MHQSKIAKTDLLPNYKLEVPTHVQHLLLAGLGIGVVGLILAGVMPADQRLFPAVLIGIGLITTIPTGLLTLVTSNRMRLNARRRMMDAVAWRGNEMLLDVGCGNGFLLLEAAKQLTMGKAIGIDVWKDNAGHQQANAVWGNAKIEGVADRIDLQNVDARQMPFEGQTFDVIMSSLALHHMGSNADREQALQEMARVLKPGGTILLYDMLPFINQASAVLRQQGFRQVKKIGGSVLMVLSASK